MNTKYIDLIQQTYYFPQEGFSLTKENTLKFHDVDLMSLVEQYGSPFKFCYLPKISENINKTKKWFQQAIKELKYEGNYNYCYCTKSSHFSFVLNEAIKNDIHLETSSEFDIDIINHLLLEKKIDTNNFVLCNGFKQLPYINKIADLINKGYTNVIPIIDNYEEFDLLESSIEESYNVGIRIASEEEPKFQFYTSRLGIGYKNILPFYRKNIAENPKVSLKVLHFFINTGIRDTAYYWNELVKCLKVYIALKKECPTLDSLNIGGGLPIKNSLAFEYDYYYMIREILNQIKSTCDEAGVKVPHIFTEFGSFTVGESGGVVYKILNQKQQNDRENWNMINSSFITTLPDTWALNKRFVLLALNRWNETYERVFLGGLTCDSDDYYNSEQDLNAIYLPKYNADKPLYIGFFNTGAYQENIGGFGGIQHCLIPRPKHILIQKDEQGNLVTEVFAEEQTQHETLKLLGYK